MAFAALPPTPALHERERSASSSRSLGRVLINASGGSTSHASRNRVELRHGRWWGRTSGRGSTDAHTQSRRSLSDPASDPACRRQACRDENQAIDQLHRGERQTARDAGLICTLDRSQGWPCQPWDAASGMPARVLDSPRIARVTARAPPSYLTTGAAMFCRHHSRNHRLITRKRAGGCSTRGTQNGNRTIAQSDPNNFQKLPRFLPMTERWRLDGTHGAAHKSVELGIEPRRWCPGRDRTSDTAIFRLTFHQ